MAADQTQLKTAFNEAIQGAQGALAELQTSYTAYSDRQKAQPADSTADMDATQKAIYEKQMILRELNRAEDTLNQQYLDFKAAPPTKTFFAKIGLSSPQDWSLAFFFFSFGFMMVMITLVLAMQSTAPLRAAGFFLALTAMLAFIIALVIRAVA